MAVAIWVSSSDGFARDGPLGAILLRAAMMTMASGVDGLEERKRGGADEFAVQLKLEVKPAENC